MEGESPPQASKPVRAVFLSYASQDAEAAQRICAALRFAGVELWFDQSELRGGDVWDRSIRKQIKSCALFMPLISRSTHDRDEGYFRLEWKLAIDRYHLMAADRTFLMPVVIDDTPDDDDRVPDRFKEVQWTRLPGGETTPAFVERVRHMLSAGGPGSPAPGRPSLEAPLSVDPAPKQQPMNFPAPALRRPAGPDFTALHGDPRYRALTEQLYGGLKPTGAP